MIICTMSFLIKRYDLSEKGDVFVLKEQIKEIYIKKRNLIAFNDDVLF